MTKELADSLKKLRRIAPKLNSATDAANEVVARVEKFLNDECSLGLPCEVLVSKNRIGAVYEDEEPTRNEENEVVRLCYARVNSRFRIAVNTSKEEVDGEGFFIRTLDSGSTVEWASCPRDVKLSTFNSLPWLLEKLQKEAEESAKSVEQTTETVKKVLAALGESPKK